MPPASGRLTSCSGAPAASRPKLPRLVLRTTSVASGGGVPSRRRAVTVSVAGDVEFASSCPWSVAIETVRSDGARGPPGDVGSTGLLDFSLHAATQRASARRETNLGIVDGYDSIINASVME